MTFTLDAPAGAPGWQVPLYGPGQSNRVTPGCVASPNVDSPLVASATESSAKTIDAGEKKE